MMMMLKLYLYADSINAFYLSHSYTQMSLVAQYAQGGDVFSLQGSMDTVEVPPSDQNTVMQTVNIGHNWPIDDNGAGGEIAGGHHAGDDINIEKDSLPGSDVGRNEQSLFELASAAPTPLLHAPQPEGGYMNAGRY